MVSQESWLMDLAVTLHPGHDAQRQRQTAMFAARLGYAAVHLPIAPGATFPEGELEALAKAAEPAMLVLDDQSAALGVVRGNDPVAVQAERAALDADGSTRPLIVAVPVSIGRTRNEAVARASRDPRFVGDMDPEQHGIFGTLDEAQAQVLELANAGATELLVTVADELDVADLLAQVRSLVVGPQAVLGGKRA